LQNKGFLA